MTDVDDTSQDEGSESILRSSRFGGQAAADDL